MPSSCGRVGPPPFKIPPPCLPACRRCWTPTGARPTTSSPASSALACSLSAWQRLRHRLVPMTQRARALVSLLCSVGGINPFMDRTGQWPAEMVFVDEVRSEGQGCGPCNQSHPESTRLWLADPASPPFPPPVYVHWLPQLQQRRPKDVSDGGGVGAGARGGAGRGRHPQAAGGHRLLPRLLHPLGVGPAAGAAGGDDGRHGAREHGGGLLASGAGICDCD